MDEVSRRAQEIRDKELILEAGGWTPVQRMDEAQVFYIDPFNSSNQLRLHDAAEVELGRLRFNEQKNKDQVKASLSHEDLTTFLYLLARDHLVIGEVEGLLDEVLRIRGEERDYSLRELGDWADRRAKELINPSRQETL